METVGNSLVFTITIITYFQVYIKTMKSILYMINKLKKETKEHELN